MSEEKEKNNLLELDLSSFNAKEIMIFFMDKDKKPLRIVEPEEVCWIKDDFFRYTTKEGFEHTIHKDNISEIKIHR